MYNDEHEGMKGNDLKEFISNTKMKLVEKIEFGAFTTEAWYYSPYPQEYWHLETLYICEYCFRFYKYPEEIMRHSERCEVRHPPGDEIYRDEKLSVFEVDGALETEYCENLCYMAKMFLDHKNIHYDTEPFLFYVVCEYDENGFHAVGYFSKEKDFSLPIDPEK